MKTLYLLRHGQSVDASARIDDKQRSLIERGITEVKKAAQHLLHKQSNVQQVIYSDALRTTMTAETMAEVMNLHSIIRDEPKLYNANIAGWLDVLQHIDNAHETVLMIGHNMGISRFASYITGEDLAIMHTSAMHAIEISVDDWKVASGGLGRLMWTFSPS